MPTEGQDLERLREAIGDAQAAPTKEASYEDMASFYMKKTLETMRRGKPEIRSERARRYAVAITEMEKAFAYFQTYIVNFDSPVENWDK